MSDAANRDRPELPEEWVEKAAGEILNFEYGKGLPARSRVEGEVGVYASAGRVGFHDEALVDEDVIVVGRKGAAGNAFLAEGPAWIIDTAYYATVPDEHDIRFLTYQLQAADMSRLDQSTAIPSLSRDDLRKVPLRLLSLDEQRRIVERIDERHAAIDGADDSLGTAGRQLVALRSAVLQRAVAMGEEHALGDLLVGIEAGRSFRCHGYPASDGKWGVVKVSAMTWGNFREEENKEVIDESAVDERWEIRSGDVLISRANTSTYVGAAVLVRETRAKLLLSDKSLRLLPRTEKISAEWLFYALNALSSRKQMSTAATGTSDSMRNLSQDKIKAVKLRVPPLAVQEDVVGRIEVEMMAAAQLERAIKGQQQASSSLRKAVLRDAMHGRLSLSDARKAA